MRLIADIFGSFRRMPGWVQAWVAVILVPVNLASLWFWPEPWGALVALLAVGGMVPNIFIMMHERGLSRAMALPHVAIWVPLVCVVPLALYHGATGAFGAYLWLLLAVDLVSLGFDIPDAWRWWHGERDVA